MMRVPILMFHSISVAEPRARTRSLYLSPRRFRSYLGHISRLGFRGVSMGEAMTHLARPADARREKVVCLTFDDGFADNAEEALPILRDFGFTATCYVTSSLLGAYNAWDSDLLRVRTRMMSRGQVREWHDAGMEVGAHTRTHCDLTSCAEASERQEEIEGSKTELEDVIGSSVSHFSYPFGRHDASAVAAVRAAGFSSAVTTREGRARSTDDRFTLPRLYVGGNYLVPIVLARLFTRAGDWASARA